MKKDHLKKNALEWSVFGVSLALIVGIVGLLLSDIIASPPAVPAFEVLADAATSMDQNLQRIVVKVKNTGGVTVENVEVEVTATSDTGEHKGHFTLQFLPRKSQRSGAAVFGPETGNILKIEARVVGYEDP